MSKVNITVSFADDVEALALAQFVKRVGFQEFRDNAANEEEAYLIRDAIANLQAALAKGGFTPR